MRLRARGIGVSRTSQPVVKLEEKPNVSTANTLLLESEDFELLYQCIV